MSTVHCFPPQAWLFESWDDPIIGVTYGRYVLDPTILLNPRTAIILSNSGRCAELHELKRGSVPRVIHHMKGSINAASLRSVAVTVEELERFLLDYEVLINEFGTKFIVEKPEGSFWAVTANPPGSMNQRGLDWQDLRELLDVPDPLDDLRPHLILVKD